MLISYAPVHPYGVNAGCRGVWLGESGFGVEAVGIEQHHVGGHVGDMELTCGSILAMRALPAICRRIMP